MSSRLTPSSSPTSGGTGLGLNADTVRLLLDLDGVLVDTRPVMESAWRQVREEHNLDLPFGEYERHLGRPFADIMQQLGLADAEPIHQTYSKASTAASHLARHFDGVAEVLHAFAAADWRLGRPYQCVCRSRVQWASGGGTGEVQRRGSHLDWDSRSRMFFDSAMVAC
ncbi:hypothetical protein CFC35_35845 [Streptomyces sp. FBKL.4005]|uniref:HAD hydrolase-like protein n=1 Tax=Streptomyces sp. FBKL.4005 TaxID=2015515 RepID=UPI000B95E88D|nr:HAD hydrolase-like protein [Streptomyces sp. FBKL.4005]OYP19199.1 hypothetical protein CFC35_35845 [Streptomyces sp. FBKL.4005]